MRACMAGFFRLALMGLLMILPLAGLIAQEELDPLTERIDQGRRAVLGIAFSEVSEAEQIAYLLACYKVAPGRFDGPASAFDLGLFTFVESQPKGGKTEAEVKEEIRVRAEALAWILCEKSDGSSVFWRQGQSVRAGVPMPGGDDAEPFLTWAIWNLRESPANRPLSEETLAIVIGAIKKKNADVAKRLCNQRDRHGTLPLFLAIQEGHNQVAKAIVQVYGPEDLKALRGNEFEGDDGMRVMDCAVLADNAEMVEYLIRSGWDISDERTWGGPCGPNGHRLSPLMKAESNGKRKASLKLQEIDLFRERQEEKREEEIWRQL